MRRSLMCVVDHVLDGSLGIEESPHPVHLILVPMLDRHDSATPSDRPTIGSFFAAVVGPDSISVDAAVQHRRLDASTEAGQRRASKGLQTAISTIVWVVGDFQATGSAVP